MFVWVKIGLLSFGGPVGQIALMHQELVERRRWISDRRFVHALNYCMLLPGPEAQQLAVYIGWLLHGRRGGVAAGLWFVLPGALFLLGICAVYVTWGQLPALAAVFYGLKAAVLAIVAQAVLKIGRKILRHPILWAIAGASFLAIFAFSSPFPLVIASALVLGWFLGQKYPQLFELKNAATEVGALAENAYLISDCGAVKKGGSRGALALEALFWFAVWLAPLGLCLFFLGWGNILTQVSWFFTKVATVTFGGAYAALPYVAQQAVEVHGWLSPREAMDGLGLAETTPGPLILVLQFVGFLAGWTQESGGTSWLRAFAAAGLASWATFAPGFLFIFAGAPLIEHTRGMVRLGHALSAVTAAVVGVVLNLAVWFGWHCLRPDGGEWDFTPIILGTFLFLTMFRWKWGVLRVLAAGAVLGGIHAVFFQ